MSDQNQIKAQGSSFLEEMSKMYEEREALFVRREAEYEKQRKELKVLLEQIRKDKRDLDQKAEKLNLQEEEQNQREAMLKDWFEDEKQARKKLEEDQNVFQKQREVLEARLRVEVEGAKNERLKVKQLSEEYEHRLGMLGLLLERQGESSTKAGEFFTALLEGGTSNNKQEVSELQQQMEVLQEQVRQLKSSKCSLQEENKQLLEERENLQQEEEKFAQQIVKLEDERKHLMELIAQLHRSSQGTTPDETGEVPESATAVFETTIPPSVSVEGQAAKPVYEELTASVLQSYLAKNGRKYESSEIRHSAEGEQLHLSLRGMEYVFLFSDPACFELSVKRKNSRALQKCLELMNQKHPEAKFWYESQEQKVYASGYFTNQIAPDVLMSKVEEISNCFLEG